MTVAEPVTRLLIIDDSVRVRRAVARALSGEPGIEVVAAMRNGRAAVTRSQRLGPDVVLLDAESAGDGQCATLAELRRLNPRPRVLMRDQVTATDGGPLDEVHLRARVLRAVHGGRGESAGRPAPTRTPEAGAAASGAHARSIPRPRREHTPGRPRRRASADTPVRAIAIAASTGGPDALEVVLAGLPPQLPVPVFVVQHMPAEFTGLLAARLDRRTRLTVAEAVDGVDVRDGEVYIAPGGRHLALQRGPEGARVVVHDGPAENSCRPAADVLFRSAAGLYGRGLLAVVLTGMGHDGTAGARAVRGAGGRVLAQSETSAVVASMPRAVARAQLADGILDLGALGPRIAAMAAQGAAR